MRSVDEGSVDEGSVDGDRPRLMGSVDGPVHDDRPGA